ncbi:MAG: tRNA guanosine(34) transglycosylase Tgt [Bacteroidota bacterium]|nr:tRNA guanosine(34) transglycosylase Tgt [Bacteroidota bacterium]
MKFQLTKSDDTTNARAAKLITDHGVINTPIFMPVGTLGTVKGIHNKELQKDVDAEIILGNTYHLYLRPGMSIIKKSGGLHKFMGWNRPILTDSGGYQVYSLSANRKIKEEGVKFKSHIDGSYHFFTPENVVEIQKNIGADIIMPLDECTPYPCNYKYAKQSMDRTHRWLKRCLEEHYKSPPKYEHEQTLFPIVQGSVFSELRKESAHFVASQNALGNAIGGLSVGEPADEMYAMTNTVCEILPKNKPRYLMGVGTPINLLENIALGVDMFDCVMPTRNGRNGMMFTSNGTINIKNQKWKNDFSPLDSSEYSYVDKDYSKAYVSHLFSVNEMLGKQILSLHNLSFYLWLVRQARKHILEGSFHSWKEKMVKNMQQRL